MRKRLGLMGLAAAAAMAAVPGVEAASSSPAPTRAPAPNAPDGERERDSVLPFRNTTPNHRKKPGPGWSNAHVQRMARKRRNVIKNRKAHR